MDDNTALPNNNCYFDADTEEAIARTPTIQDVALAAGVSTATVSRTLSSPERVSEVTRRAVEAAVERTGYTLNVAARNLRKRRAGGILALVPNIANPFFSEILGGISSVLRANGLNLLVADTETLSDGEASLVDYAADRSRADGLIVLDGRIPPAVLTGRRCPPVVMACEWMDGLDAPSVRVDNAMGARLAVEHLAGLGHRAIGHVCGPAGNVLTEARRRGFDEAMEEFGLEAQPAWRAFGEFSLDWGRRAAETYLSLDDRPTALFCASDTIACGLIGALVQSGVAVPSDISVVGFDDIDLAAHTAPALTTVRQPRRQIGTVAAQMLLDALAGHVPRSQILPVALIERRSTARR